MSRRLVTDAHELLRAALRPGDTAIDATAGGGADTLALAQMVGPTGRVYAFDIQTQAIEATRARLLEHGVDWVELRRECHSQVGERLPAATHGAVGAACFNLGYLPRGDPAIVTQPGATLRALHAAGRLLRPGGVITVIAYTGHAGGAHEAAAVQRELSGWGRGWRRLDDASLPLAPPAPRLFALEKQAER